MASVRVGRGFVARALGWVGNGTWRLPLALTLGIALSIVAVAGWSVGEQRLARVDPAQAAAALPSREIALAMTGHVAGLLGEAGATAPPAPAALARPRALSEPPLLAALSMALLVAVLWLALVLRREEARLHALDEGARRGREQMVLLEGEKKRAVEAAACDHLTGLVNRRVFNELGQKHLRQARWNARHYALLYLDLDRFKGVNDSLGHHVGDLLLQAVAARLRKALRASDVIARMGGDEFAILLTELSDVADAERLAAKLVDAIGQPCTDLDGHDLQVGTSIGIAVFPRDGVDVGTLCRNADAAMYESKRAGGARFTFYDNSLNRAGDWLFSLEQRLPRAIAEGELVLHFQPKVRLSDFRIVGLEALVRWQHPEHGLIFPKDFVALAEETGQIVELGKWVVRACIRQQAAWRAEGLTLVPVAFNVSARQLEDDHLCAFIRDELEAHALEGRLLEAEITETGLVESVEQAGRVLAALEGLGLSIALDDFGSGFSNLNYIRSMPIGTIKIDRAFVCDIRNRPSDAVIVESIVALAHKLGLCVVAEGVETLEQIVHLKTARCDVVQGYYLSRPVPAAAACELVRGVYVKQG